MEIAEIEKNASERIRIELTKWKDNDLIAMRVYYKMKLTENEWGPTRKGITCKVELLPEIIKGLQQAEKKPERQACYRITGGCAMFLPLAAIPCPVSLPRPHARYLYESCACTRCVNGDRYLLPAA